MNELDPTAVQEALQTRWLGRTYRYFPRTGSTNDLFKAALAAGGEDLRPGTVFLTDFQESGRGRLARRWEAPSGTSLLFSAYLRPAWAEERLSWLPMLAGLAVAEAVAAITGLDVRLKWPNDLVLLQNGRWHKFCGMLLESGAASTGPPFVILGIGVNVNIPATQLPDTPFPATSLLVAAGQPLSRRALLVAIMGQLEAGYDAAQEGKSPHAAWQERLIWLNEEVSLSRLGADIDQQGVFEGTDEQGHLKLRDGDGRVHLVAAGDVSLRPSGGKIDQASTA